MQQTIERLHQLRLPGFVEGLIEQQQGKLYRDLPFDERLGLLVEKEYLRRENSRLATRIKQAQFKQPVTIDSVDFNLPRKLVKAKYLELAQCRWVENAQNLIICGPTGVGKSCLACALGDQACKLGYSVRYIKLRKLISEILQARADGSFRSFWNRLAKISLLIIDEWLREPISQADAREISDLVDDRYATASCIFASQLPTKDWYQQISDPTLAESILDRLVHESHRLELDGESIRKLRANRAADDSTENSLVLKPTHNPPLAKAKHR